MAPGRVYEQEFTPIPVHEAVASFLTSSEVKHLGDQTIREYQHELNRFSDWARTQKLMLDQVNAKAVDAFLEHLKATYKPQQTGKKELSTYTLASQVRVILTFLNWCIDSEEYADQVKHETIRRIKKPKVVKVIIETFTVEQIADLRKACAKEYNAHLRLRDEAIILLLLDTGIRASELYTLSIANVDLAPADPHIKIFGKGKKWGEVGMGQECRKFMAQYLRKFRLPTMVEQIKEQQSEKSLSERESTRIEKQYKEANPFFMNRYGRALTLSGLESTISRLGEWAEIEGVRCSPHTFRHTFASMFMRNGGDIYTLSKLLRHSSVKVTENYLQSIRQWEARYHAQSVVDNL